MIWDIALTIVFVLFLIALSTALIITCVCKYKFDCHCRKALCYRISASLALWWAGIIFLYMLLTSDYKIDENYVPMMNRTRKDVRIQIK